MGRAVCVCCATTMPTICQHIGWLGSINVVCCPSGVRYSIRASLVLAGLDGIPTLINDWELSVDAHLPLYAAEL